jgi:hypothetical protein
VQLLAERVVARELLEFGYYVGVPAQVKVSVDAQGQRLTRMGGDALPRLIAFCSPGGTQPALNRLTSTSLAFTWIR